MKKFTKQLLTGVVALGLLAPIATQINTNTNPTMQIQAKRHARHSNWHKGNPSILRHNSLWLGSPVKIHSNGWGKYGRDLTPLGGKYGFNPTPLYFKANHHYKTNGADAGAAAAINPRYRSIGYHKYQMKDYGLSYIVKVHNRNHISIWYTYHHHYCGYFHRISKRTAHHFLYHPYF